MRSGLGLECFVCVLVLENWVNCVLYEMQKFVIEVSVHIWRSVYSVELNLECVSVSSNITSKSEDSNLQWPNEGWSSKNVCANMGFSKCEEIQSSMMKWKSNQSSKILQGIMYTSIILTCNFTVPGTLPLPYDCSYLVLYLLRRLAFNV